MAVYHSLDFYKTHYQCNVRNSISVVFPDFYVSFKQPILYCAQRSLLSAGLVFYNCPLRNRGRLKTEVEVNN